jgi:radical SAM/Cys-rich protein
MPFQKTISKPEQTLEEKTPQIASFNSTLSQHNLRLVRQLTHTLQINLGYLCNQTCRHCHLDAGPGRKENMDADTIEEVVAYARRSHFEIVDITGGAPELNPQLVNLIEKVSPLTPRIMLRSNLSALKAKMPRLIEAFKSNRVMLVASFPSLNLNQTDSQRGDGIFEESIAVLKALNAIGYGHNGAGLELNLVSNPTGAFLPPGQEKTEKRYRQVLDQKWGVRFNRLFSFANVPLGRFRNWLIRSGNFESYMQKLVSNFNPCAAEGLMCRTLVSVSWDGHLFDCDFNLARGLYMGGKKIHVSEMPGAPQPHTPIITADHCYTCAAGSGFT